MIKKYMTQLYKEIMWYKKKIDTGKIRYFCDKNEGNADEYIVYLKDGSYFYIAIGSKYIPNIPKKKIAYIYKRICRQFEKGSEHISYFVDSDKGFFSYKGTIWCDTDYIVTKEEKYRIDHTKEIDTGYWD